MMSERCEHSTTLEAWFDRRTSELESRRVERHLETCAECQRELDRLEALRATLRESLADRPNPFAMRRLRHRVLNLARGGDEPPRTRLRPPHLAWIAAFLAGAALMITGAASLWARLTTREALLLATSPGASYADERAPGRRVVRLTEGEFDFDVDSSVDGRQLLVLVPEGEIEDIGTHFRVVVRGGHTVSVSVTEGEVEVRLRDLPQRRLVAGMSWNPEATRGSGRAPDSLPHEEVGPKGPPERADSSDEPQSVESPPTGTLSRNDAESSNDAESANDATAGRAAASLERGAASLGDDGKATRTPGVPRKKRSRGPATLAERPGPRVAVRTNESQADEKSREVIETSPRGEVVRADGAAEDAAYLAFLSALRRGDGVAARRAGRAYLDEFPNGLRAPEVSLRMGELASEVPSLK